MLAWKLYKINACVLAEANHAGMKPVEKGFMALVLIVADQLLNDRLCRQNLSHNPKIHLTDRTMRLSYDYSVVKTKMRKHRALQPMHPLINNFLFSLLRPDRVEHVTKGGDLHIIQPLYTESEVWRMMAWVRWRHEACQ